MPVEFAGLAVPAGLVVPAAGLAVPAVPAVPVGHRRARLVVYLLRLVLVVGALVWLRSSLVGLVETGMIDAAAASGPALIAAAIVVFA